MQKRNKYVSTKFSKRVYIPFVFLSVLLLVASYFVFLSPSVFLQYLRLQSSISVGERYYGRVRLWYFYAQAGDWTHALALESGIDPQDISLFRLANYPPEIKKRLNSLMIKNPRSPDDLIELAKIQASLNKFSEATISTAQANLADPIRTDLEKIYYKVLP